MNILLSIYAPTILASILWALGLACLGAQLAARDRAMQTLCLSQGAMLGVLLGLGLCLVFIPGENWMSWSLPFVLALLAATLTFAASQRLIRRGSSSSNTHFASLFALLIAGSYLVSALFPALENHMAQKYFGDLATLSSAASWSTVGCGILLALLLLRWHHSFTRQAFEGSILGSPGGRVAFLFNTIALIVICYSVQTVGFLFTIACLFIPTSFVSHSRHAGLARHLRSCALIAATAAGMGFFISLLYTHLPTVPTIVALMSLISFGTLLLERRSRPSQA